MPSKFYKTAISAARRNLNLGPYSRVLPVLLQVTDTDRNETAICFIRCSLGIARRRSDELPQGFGVVLVNLPSSLSPEASPMKKAPR